MSKIVEVTDIELYHLEWLHENIRNEHEHFIPKLYLVQREYLKMVSIICLEKVKLLMFESGNIITSRDLKHLLSLIFDMNNEAISLLNSQ